MRLLIAALAITLAVAVTASVFAIWPVVADAPWENDTPVVVDRTAELRCQGALDYRNSIIEAGRYSSGGESQFFPNLDRGPGNPGGVRNYEEALGQAEREISRYC